MNTPKKFLAWSLLALACFAVATVARSGAQPPTGYATTISFEPLGANGILLKAQMKELQTGTLLAGPQLKMPLGETATSESTLPDGTVVVLTATVDATKKSIQYSLVAKNGDRELSSHTAKISL